MKQILRIMIVGIVMVAVTCVNMPALAVEAEKAPVNAGNTVCPVMGTKVVPGKALTVEYDGKLYNVCCPVCVNAFKNDPKKYSDIAEKQIEKQNTKEE